VARNEFIALRFFFVSRIAAEKRTGRAFSMEPGALERRGREGFSSKEPQFTTLIISIGRKLPQK